MQKELLTAVMVVRSSFCTCVSSLIQESVSLSQDKEESEDANFAVTDETEKQKTTMENTENTRNFNTNNTLSSIVQNNVSKIIVTNGSTGEKREIDDVEEINNLLEQIKELKIISQAEKMFKAIPMLWHCIRMKI